MRIDWVPWAAAALVIGVVALSVGSILTPESTGGALRIVEQDQRRWLAIVGLFLLASIGMTLGLPAVASVFDDRGNRLALVAMAIFSVGCIGIAGYAVLLAVYRALAVGDMLDGLDLEGLLRHAGLMPWFIGWVLAFLLGELLLAWALFKTTRVARWVPILMLVHVAVTFLSSLLPEIVSTGNALVLTVAFSALGIAANQSRLPPIH